MWAEIFLALGFTICYKIERNNELFKFVKMVVTKH
jgi:hypothetical protein